MKFRLCLASGEKVLPLKMAVRGAAANSLLLKRGFDRRKEEELLRIFKAADTNQVYMLEKTSKFIFSAYIFVQDGFLSVDEYVNVFRQRGIAITSDEVAFY